MVAEFEADLIRLRTREGMKVAKAKGRLRGKQPKLKPNQAKHLLEPHDSGSYTRGELAELFGVGRSTVYRTIERMRPKPPEPERPFAPLANAEGEAAPGNPALRDHVERTGNQCPGAPPNDVSAAEETTTR